jgi:hypothetical protein
MSLVAGSLRVNLLVAPNLEGERAGIGSTD